MLLKRGCMCNSYSMRAIVPRPISGGRGLINPGLDQMDPVSELAAGVGCTAFSLS